MYKLLATFFIFALNFCLAEESQWGKKDFFKKICHQENLQACLDIDLKYTSKIVPKIFPHYNLTMIQIPQRGLDKICAQTDCYKLQPQQVIEVAQNIETHSKNNESQVGLDDKKEKGDDDLKNQGSEKCLQNKKEKQKAEIAARVTTGTNVYNFLGATKDFPRSIILGVGGGLIFCSGKCQAFIDLYYGRGDKDQIVKSSYQELEGKVTFIWAPINIKDRVKFGIGPDVAVRRGKLTHRYDDASMVSDILSYAFALNLNTEVKLIDFSNKNKDTTLKKITLGATGRFFVINVNKVCNQFKDSKGSSLDCYNQEQLRSLDQIPLNGFGIDTLFYVQGHF